MTGTREAFFSAVQPGSIGLILAAFFLSFAPARFCKAQTDGHRDGVGERPYMGWTTWSQQAHNYPTTDDTQNETNVDANANAMRNSGLAAHGFEYINIDGDWDNGLMCQCGPPITFDKYGRPIANVTRFPHGMKAVADHIHADGLKAGIYWEPGVAPQVYDANTPILGTSYHVQDIVQQPLATEFNGFYQIDFTKPGAQEYYDSIVAKFAEWGYDYLKFDGVRVGVSRSGTYIDDRPDVRAIRLAVDKSGRPMYLNLSSNLNHDYAAWWGKWANGRRIDGDIECYFGCGNANTEWSIVVTRFADLIPWQTDASPRRGWNDLDSLEVGNGTITTYPSNSPEILVSSNPPSKPISRAGQPALVDGLTEVGRKTMLTFWAIAAAPLQLGDDLTILDDYGIEILTNDEVIAVDQSGRSGKVIVEGNTPVWAQSLCDGTYYVALFNLNETNSSASVKWADLGFTGPANLRDLWLHQDMGTHADAFTADLTSHESMLLKVTPIEEHGKRQAEQACEATF
jgi:alpha-galactosidase